MNTKNKVNNLLWQGLLALMQEKDIKDLVDKSLVCRASFYKNFENIDQVIDYGLDKIFNKIFIDKPIEKHSVIDNIYHTCKSFYDDREIFILLYNQGMKNKIIEIFEKGTLISLNQLDLSLPKYHDSYFAGASTAVLLAWLENDFIETPEEMTKVIVTALTSYPIISLKE